MSPSSSTQDCHVLTPAQEAVLCQISTGSTVIAAAEAAGVHRNTVLNWRRNSAHFRAALCCAREEKVLFWRDQNEQLAAALHILDRSCRPPYLLRRMRWLVPSRPHRNP
jgi:hypothetical protein